MDYLKPLFEKLSEGDSLEKLVTDLAFLLRGVSKEAKREDPRIIYIDGDALLPNILFKAGLIEKGKYAGYHLTPEGEKMYNQIKESGFYQYRL